MEKDRWVLPTTTSMDFLRLVVVWVGGGKGRRRRKGDSGCELGSRGGPTAPQEVALGLPVPAACWSLTACGFGAAQQSPSVAMATSISLLPISSKALARLLRSPSSCCRASQRSRITPVGLAFVAK